MRIHISCLQREENVPLSYVNVYSYYVYSHIFTSLVMAQ